MKTRITLGVAAVGILAAQAQADWIRWHLNAEDAPPQNPWISHDGGTIDSVTLRYNQSRALLDWTVRFNDQRAQGMSMVLNDGPMPSGNPGVYAMLYLDATNIDDPVLSAFAFNGRKDRSSWEYGDNGMTDNIDMPPDFITGSTANNTLVRSFDVRDTDDGGRILSVRMNLDTIDNHSPLYNPGGAEAWFGAGFSPETIGIWMGVMTDLQTAYDETGRLTAYHFGTEGYVDGVDLTVPAPGPAALALLGVAAATRRRR